MDLGIRSFLELWLTRFALLLIPRLPRRCVMGLARLLGDMGYGLSRHLRRVGRANLDIAFGKTRDAKWKRRILRTSFRTFALVILDLFWFSRDSRNRIEQFVHFDESFAEFFKPAARICLTAHLGNWELLGRAAAMKGSPMASVAAPLANRPLDTLFNRIRSDTGQRVVSKRGAIRALLKILRDNRKVALLLDQNTKPSESGLFVEFFGKPAPVSTAAAALALRSRTPILFGYCIPDQQGHYTISRMQQMLPPEAYDQEDRQACTRRLTRDIACSMENKIREYPEHWLWMYKRWKYIAPGYTREDYPFYAKELTPHDRKIAEATLQAARPTT